MAEKHFLVEFKSGDDPQPLIADRGFEDEECLIFVDSEGYLVGFFDLKVVQAWREIENA